MDLMVALKVITAWISIRVAWFDGDILEFRMEKYGMYEG